MRSPKTEPSIDPPLAELDSFLQLAIGELKGALALIEVYADLLEGQVSSDPSLQPMREALRGVRHQADVVTVLVDEATHGPGR